jgi:hypothetical protein
MNSATTIDSVNRRACYLLEHNNIRSAIRTTVQAYKEARRTGDTLTAEQHLDTIRGILLEAQATRT